MEQLSSPDTKVSEINLNYQRLMAEPQERNEHGQLVHPLAQVFEARMNRALEEWDAMRQFSGEVAILGGQIDGAEA